MHQAQDKISVTAGQETFSPIPYHSFTIGPVTIETTIADGETMEQAYERAYALAAKLLKSQYEPKLEEFFELQKQALNRGFDEAKNTNGSRDYAPPPQDFGKPANPIAQGMGDLISTKQIGMLQSIARKCGFDLQEECDQIFPNCKYNELSRKAASTLIDHCKEIEKQFDAGTYVPRNPAQPTFLPEKTEDEFSGPPPTTVTVDDDIPF